MIVSEGVTDANWNWRNGKHDGVFTVMLIAR